MSSCDRPIKSHYTTLVLMCCFLTGPILLSGCLDTTTTRIEGSGSEFQPSFRATINLDGPVKPASEIRSGSAIEMSYQQGKIISDQALPSGSYPVVLANTYFLSGPQLTNEFKFSYTNALLRIRGLMNDLPIGGDVSIGIGSSSMDITINSQIQHASQQFREEGFEIGLGLLWRVNNTSSLHLNYATFYALSTDADSYGAYYQAAIANNLALRAGYTVWKVTGITGNSSSDYYLKYSGPSLALQLAF